MERSYFITMLMLVIHEIDAAYWHEWDMFMVPGGIQGFLLFNIVIIPLVFVGYKAVVTHHANAPQWGIFCGALGAITFAIHGAFLLVGFEQFTLPFSLGVIVICLLSSIVLLFESRKALIGT